MSENVARPPERPQSPPTPQASAESARGGYNLNGKGEFKVSAEATPLAARLIEFLKDFKIEVKEGRETRIIEKYRAVAREMSKDRAESFVVDFEDLLAYDRELADWFVAYPEHFLEAAKSAIAEVLSIEDPEYFKEVKHIYPRIRGLEKEPALYRKIRELTVEDEGRIYVFEGYVAKKDKEREEAPEVVYECIKCGMQFKLLLGELPPPRCPRCRSDTIEPVTPVNPGARPEVVRVITLEEPPESVSPGDVLERVDVLLVGKDLVYHPHIKPGAKLTVLGIVKKIESSPVMKKRPRTREVYIEAVNVEAEVDNEFGEIRAALYADKKPNHAMIASSIVRYLTSRMRIVTPVLDDGELGVYCYEDGVYVECEKRLEAEVKRIYDKLYMDRKGVKLRGLLAEFFTHLRNETKIERGFSFNLLVFKNGVLDWDLIERGEYRLLPHSPDLFAYFRIPHEVDVSVFQRCNEDNLEECAGKEIPFFYKTFREWVGEKWVLLLAILGYCLRSKDYALHKAVMLVGEGSNGKSTYLDLLRWILGPENVASIPLQDLAENRFAGANLFGKLANIYADLPRKPLKEAGLFKILTGEDYACWDRKFKDRICFVNVAKLIFSANELPVVTDMTYAFWRRWIVVEFPNQFPENPGFKKMILENPEIPKLIALSILAFKKVLREGKFPFEETATDYREIWLRKTNSVYAFLRTLEETGINGTKMVRDTQGRVLAPELYNLYVEFCEEEDLEAVSKKTFTEEMERLGFPKKKSGSHYYYYGLRLVQTEEKTP